MRNPINLVLSASLLSHTGVQGQRILLALYLIDLGAQPLTVGILAGTFSVCHAVLAVQVGRIADRSGARILILCGLAIAALGMCLPFFFHTMPAIFAAALMGSFAVSITNISTQNLVGLLSTTENRTRNFANYSLCNSVASFVGPMIAGFSIDHIGHAPACLVVGLLFIAPLPIVALGGAIFDKGGGHKEHKKGRFRDLLATPGLLRTAMIGGLQNLGDVLFQFYLPVYAKSIGLSASVIGVILAMNAAAAFVVRIWLPRIIRHFGEAGLLARAFYLGTVGLVLIPLFENPFMLGLVSFLFGLGMGCTGPIVTMLMFANSPPGRSGETMGLKATFNQGIKVGGPAALGAVAGVFGLLPVFWITAALMAYGGWMSNSWRNAAGSGGR